MGKGPVVRLRSWFGAALIAMAVHCRAIEEPHALQPSNDGHDQPSMSDCDMLVIDEPEPYAEQPAPRTTATYESTAAVNRVVAHLNELFWTGRPTNDFSRAGVLVRGEDSYDAGRVGKPWLPCSAATCGIYNNHWCASLINQYTPALYAGPGWGWVINQSFAKLQCAYPGMRHTRAAYILAPLPAICVECNVARASPRCPRCAL